MYWKIFNTHKLLEGVVYIVVLVLHLSWIELSWLLH